MPYPYRVLDQFSLSHWHKLAVRRCMTTGQLEIALLEHMPDPAGGRTEYVPSVDYVQAIDLLNAIQALDAMHNLSVYTTPITHDVSDLDATG